MIFRKKFITILLSSLGVAGGWRIISSQITSNENQITDWEKLLELTKNIKNVEINSSIDSNIGSMNNKNRFLYSLFSTNLDTFTKQFHNYFYKWSLYQWRDWFLKNTSNGSFPKTKISLLKDSKKQEAEIEFSAENWSNKNASITNNYDLLNKEFLDLTLKTIWKNSDNSDIDTESSESDSYGDLEYTKTIKFFQKFIFDEWMTQIKPMVLCKKTWNLNSSFKSNLYNESNKNFLLPEHPNFDFPDYSDSEDSIKKFHKNKKCEKSILTMADLPNMDGREIDGLISQYFQNDSVQNDNQEISDIHKFFIDNDCKDCNIKAPNENVIKKDGPLKDENNKKFSSLKRVKWGNNNGVGVYIRTSSGITFLQFNKDTTNPKKAFLSESYEIKNFDLSSELKKFFLKKPGELLAKYFSKNLEQKKIFPLKEKHPSLYDLAEKTWKFAEEIERNQHYWKTMSKLSNSIKGYSKVTFKDQKPDFSAGLGDSLSLKRKLNKDSSATKEGTFLESISDDNNGTFELLNKYYDGNNETLNISGLNKSALELKMSLSKHINTFLNLKVFNREINSEKEKSSYFLGDYVMDNVYFQFVNKDKGEFIKKATMGLMLVNEMKFDYSKNNLDDLTNNWIKEIETNDKSAIKNIIKNSIGNIYYGTQYLSEPIELRINYGGFKFETPNKKCFKHIDTNNSALNQKDDCSAYTNNQKEWIQKLNNYWNMKNYVFNNYGYELSSEEMLNYLKFLFSFQTLIKKDFKNLKNFVSEKISPDRHGALIWIDDAHVYASDSITGIKENEKIKNFEKYFRTTKWDEIFNPFFSKSINVQTTETSNLSTGHIGAYAIISPNKKREMFGFQGLYTESLNSKNLPENIRNSVFYKFSNSNPDQNENYLMSEKGQYGIGFGKIKDDKTENFLKTINNFSTESSLKEFLEDIVPDLVEEVWEDTNQNLNEKKQSIIQKVNGNLEKYSQQLKKLSSRFAGMLQNPEASDSMFKNNVFYIPKTGDKNEGHLVYIIQVNRRDFEDGFSDFVKTIGSDTFIKMIFKLSMEDQISKEILFKHFINQGINV